MNYYIEFKSSTNLHFIKYKNSISIKFVKLYEIKSILLIQILIEIYQIVAI